MPNFQSGRESPLAFRFHVAMQGVLGVGGHILNWSAEDCARARGLIEAYKRLRPIVQQGSQYWLAPPSAAGSPCAVQYVSPDRRQTVVFLYQVRGVVGQGLRRVRLRGLDPDRRYRRAAAAESTGAALMGSGIPAAFPSAHRH